MELTGTSEGFSDAVRELCEEGAAQTAEELPKVSFLTWNTDDPEQFDRIYGQTPVELSLFYRDFAKQIPAVEATRRNETTDISILRVACDQAVGAHYHSLFEIDYVMHGTAEIELNGTLRTLRRGEFCFISPDLPHDIRPKRGAQVICLTIPGITVENTLYRLLGSESILSRFFRTTMNDHRVGYMILSTSDDRRIRLIVREMLHGVFAREPYAKEIASDLLAILLADLLRRCGGSGELESTPAERGKSAVMLTVLKHMQENYRTITLEHLAAQFGYDPSYLGKMIRANIGKSYTEAILELKLNEAKRLLTQTELSVEKVAEQAGFHSQVHFFRTFQKRIGCTPGAYRKQTAE